MSGNILSTIRKKHGDEAIFQFGETANNKTSVIPTGSFLLDRALGVGGVPLGRIVEIYGPESSGKTTVCQSIAAQAQRLGAQVSYVDVEHALDPTWMTACGVDINSCYISQPDYGEKALNIVEDLLGLVSLIIVDSVAGLVPKAELDGEMGDSHMALQARLMSQALRKISGKVKNSNTTVIFTNQMRDRIGVVWGNPETTTGGKALRYWASQRIETRRGQPLKYKEETYGTEIRIVIRKNKVAPPFKATVVPLRFDSGISLIDELITLGIESGIIEKAGAWFTVGESKVQGSQALYDLLSRDEETRNLIEDQYRKQNGLPLRRLSGD